MKQLTEAASVAATAVVARPIRQFLTPQVWKQARGRSARRPRSPAMGPPTLGLDHAGHDLGRRRLAAREVRDGPRLLRGLLSRPQAPRQDHPGIPEGPGPAAHATAAGPGRRRAARDPPPLAERLLVDGFEPMGCDGSRIECPRTAELEARLRQAGKDDSAPTLWVTAFVHLGTGLFWSWRLGPGPPTSGSTSGTCWRRSRREALIVADAAYMGYELASGHRAEPAVVPVADVLEGRPLHPRGRELTTWSEGPVFYWPKYVQEKGLPPLRAA